MNCFAAALLAGSLSTGAWAQSTTASSSSPASRQELPEQLQTALRKMVTAMLLTSVKESKMGAQSITAFSKETDRVLAATAMNDLFLIETQLKVTLKPDGTADPEGQGEVMVNFSMDANVINDVVTRICRNALPQISAADRIRAASVCR